MKFDAFAIALFNNLDQLWTLLLLLVRYTGLMILLPGIGQGISGLKVRVPAIFALSLASFGTVRTAPMPTDLIILAASFIGEFSFGFLIGMIPYLSVVAIQAGAQLATNTMGLSATQLFDPTTGASSTDLAKIQGDVVVIAFLLLGGHYTVIQAVAGLSGTFTPGYFMYDGFTASYLVDRVNDIFRVGVMVAAPVLVALLLTQFVMGIISKAVPTVNIFIVSFPLTIGIGLVITMLALPEVIRFISSDFSTMDNKISIIIENMTDYTKK